MKRYIVSRIARVVPVVILISMATFALLHLAPGGPAGVLSGNARLAESDLARIRENLGLDEPLPLQYFAWVRRVFLRLDFGSSYATGRPVSAMIGERVPATLELMGAAFALALLAAVFLGIVSALRRDGLFDQLASVLSIGGMSLPVFWLGLLAIYLFSLRLGILPSGGRETIGGGGGAIDHLRHLVLPACVLSIGFFASWSRYVRAQLITVMEGDFVRTARAKGLSERAVIGKHALRNAALPVLSVIVMQIPVLFTGAVITETVFSWPGMGRMFYEGLARHDYPMVLGIVVISSFLVLLCNLFGDLLYAAVDPRITPGGRTAAPAPGRDNRALRARA